MVVTAKGNNHDPVMLDRVVELLAPSLAVPDAVYVDCTLGLGGHARAVLEAAPSARLIGIDRDPEALAVARERLGLFAERIALVKAVYDCRKCLLILVLIRCIPYWPISESVPCR